MKRQGIQAPLAANRYYFAVRNNAVTERTVFLVSRLGQRAVGFYKCPTSWYLSFF
jgi:hypothetical protein